MKMTAVLVFALTVSIFTQLRFGPIGLGEICLLGVFIISILKATSNGIIYEMPFTFFWLLFIVATLFGFANNVILLGSTLDNSTSIIFDLLAYIFIFLCCFGVEFHFLNKSICAKRSLLAFFVLFYSLIASLFVLSFFVSSIGPFQITVGPFFAPLVDNLHQTAMFVAILPSLSLYFFAKSDKFKVFYFVLSLLSIFIVVKTGSSKAIAGALLSYLLMLAYIFLKNFNTKSKFIFFIIVYLLILGVFALFFDLSSVIGAFNAADRGGARAILYSQAIQQWLNSFIIGYGPGAHLKLEGEWTDAHQTFFTALLQGGIVAVLLLCYFLYNLCRTIFKADYLLFCLLIPLMFYAIGGDLLRRLPIWMFLIIIFYLSRQQNISDSDSYQGN